MAEAAVSNGDARPRLAKAARQAAIILVAAVLAGAVRQALPGGIHWAGRWPTADTSAEEAYKMMAKAGDPPFVPLAEAIKLHMAGHALFIDARASDEYEAGRIPHARSLPFYEFDAKRETALAGVEADRTLIIYCEGVGCELSLFLGRELMAQGFTGVKIFYGGFPEWKNAGLPVEK